jgi:hypothetical protein
MTNVVIVVSKLVNFVKSKGMNHRQFKVLCVCVCVCDVGYEEKLFPGFEIRTGCVTLHFALISLFFFNWLLQSLSDLGLP